MVDNGPADDELSIDWDYLLKNLPDDHNIDFSDQQAGGGFAYSPDSACSLSVEDIEQYLMNDEFSYPEEKEKIVIEEGFLSDVLLDSLPESESDGCRDFSNSPESIGVAAEEEDKPQGNSADVAHTEEKTDAEADAEADGDADADDDDPIAKKRKRQMRNRDAALRSRERKKMYVKELEMKSKFYEAECKRLGIILQSCLAENQALRFSLHNSKAFDASKSKQESAVLLLESLLLGSLLGFLGIMYLLILLPSQLLPTALPRVEEWGSSSVAPRKEGSSDTPRNWFRLSILLGKRCKASRSRMKKNWQCARNCSNVLIRSICFS